MRRSVLGARIRERRRQIGVTQAALASTIGISASYLNLIESNKRRIGGALLTRVAEALKLSSEDLDGAAEQRLIDALGEVAHFPDIAALDVEEGEIGDFVGRYPGWARAIAALARSERQANETARALADRLTHDPFLGETVHRMLTRISAIRSAAEILNEFQDIPRDQRLRFHNILNEESRGLTDVGEALATYFDSLETDENPLTPLDEVEALFETRQNRFAEIEVFVSDLLNQTSDASQAEDLAGATCPNGSPRSCSLSRKSARMPRGCRRAGR